MSLLTACKPRLGYMHVYVYLYRTRKYKKHKSFCGLDCQPLCHHLSCINITGNFGFDDI